jgi:hypothetical protein
MGTLVLAGLAELEALPTTFNYGALSNLSQNAQVFPLFVLAIILALLVGTIAIYIGSNLVGKKYNEKNRVLRAYRVGETQNSLLAESLRDTNAKFEVAAGILGVLLILFVFGVVFFAFGAGIFGAIPENQAQAPTSSPYFLTAIFGGLGGLASLLIRKSATIGFLAIDNVLASHPATEPAIASEASS